MKLLSRLNAEAMKNMGNFHGSVVDVAIIGAGPYGLSLAAHLRALGIDFRIFGSPMRTWLTQMPKGMRLKSEGFASSLYDPDSAFTLAQYCKVNGLPYAETGLPVPLETFISYGLEFQRLFVPQLENRVVVSLQRISGGFRIGFADGDLVDARRVVVAVGIGHFGYVPPIFSALPHEFATHSSKHSVLDGFKGREVSVVGAGASALDLAALLQAAGAHVQLIARKPAIRFHDPPLPGPRPLLQRVRLPMTGIGSGWKLLFFAKAPRLFHLLPERMRLDAVRVTLGPAPAWFTKEAAVGKVPFHLGVQVTHARVQNGRVHLQMTDSRSSCQNLVSDHVIAATGYKVDLRRLAFLDADLRVQIHCVEQAPVLSGNFESSIRGLYFVGASAANSFGPLLRFAFGASFAARHLSRHLERSVSRESARSRSAASLPAFDGSSLDVIP